MAVLDTAVEEDLHADADAEGCGEREVADGPPGPLPKPKVTWAEHGDRFVAGVENGPLSATQFHPEKSGDAGAHLLTNWLNTLA